TPSRNGRTRRPPARRRRGRAARTPSSAWGSWGQGLQLVLPQHANAADLALDGPRHAFELSGDLVVGVPFHLPQRNLSQLVLVEQIEQPAALVGHLRRLFDRRLAAEQLVNVEIARNLARLMTADDVDGPRYGARRQQPPEVVAVG